jgi:hypothetical protein
MDTNYRHFASMAGWAFFVLAEGRIEFAFNLVCVLGDRED